MNKTNMALIGPIILDLAEVKNETFSICILFYINIILKWYGTPSCCDVLSIEICTSCNKIKCNFINCFFPKLSPNSSVRGFNTNP